MSQNPTRIVHFVLVIGMNLLSAYTIYEGFGLIRRMGSAVQVVAAAILAGGIVFLEHRIVEYATSGKSAISGRWTMLALAMFFAAGIYCSALTSFDVISKGDASDTVRDGIGRQWPNQFNNLNSFRTQMKDAIDLANSQANDEIRAKANEIAAASKEEVPGLRQELNRLKSADRNFRTRMASLEEQLSLPPLPPADAHGVEEAVGPVSTAAGSLLAELPPSARNRVTPLQIIRIAAPPSDIQSQFWAAASARRNSAISAIALAIFIDLLPLVFAASIFPPRRLPGKILSARSWCAQVRYAAISAPPDAKPYTLPVHIEGEVTTSLALDITVMDPAASVESLRNIFSELETELSRRAAMPVRLVKYTNVHGRALEESEPLLPQIGTGQPIVAWSEVRSK